MTTEPLATLSASFLRRAFGISVLLILGGSLLYLSLFRDHSSFMWQGILALMGLTVLYLADWMRRATSGRLMLDRERLYDDTGRTLAMIDEVTKVERGAFAIKPSNGFVLSLNRAPGRAWAPGMWWRSGKRVGVGGVTSAGQGKFMADMVAAILEERKELAKGQDGSDQDASDQDRPDQD